MRLTKRGGLVTVAALGISPLSPLTEAALHFGARTTSNVLTVA